ncbi:YolD-like family protein, partial [Staphylococcus epidermidis]
YQYMIDQNKVSRPVLSDDQLSQLNIHLHEALQQSRPVNIKYYEEGYINFIELIIHRIDSMNYEIEGTAPHSRERHKVSFLDIIDISFI